MTLRPVLRWALPPALWLASVLPASASVTITFWSHELGNSFPHAFITMRGTPDAGGAPVDLNIGFTARHISPAILFGKVKGMLEPADFGYLKGSDAHFSVTLTDDQYVKVLKVLDSFGPAGDQTYDLNHRNCVDFVRQVAAALALAGTEQPKLMKKPRSFLEAVEAANAGRVATVEQHGADYVKTLPHLAGIDPAKPVLTATAPVPPALAFSARPGATIVSAAPAITTESMSTGKAKADASAPAPQ